MEKEYNYDRVKVLYMIHDAYHDMLIVETLTRGNRGTKAGFEQEGYWITHHDDVRIFMYYTYYFLNVLDVIAPTKLQQDWSNNKDAERKLKRYGYFFTTCIVYNLRFYQQKGPLLI